MGDLEPTVIEGTVVERLINARRMPVVPAWIRDDVTRRAAAKYAVIHFSHLAAFHGARSPKYAGKMVLHSPRGAVRSAGRVARWVLDIESQPLLSNMVATNDTRLYLALKKDRGERVKVRLTGLAVVMAAVAGGCAVLAVMAPVLAQVAAVAGAIGLFGYLGRPLDRVWLDVPVLESRARNLDPGQIYEAFEALGLEGINKAIRNGLKPVDFRHPCHKDGPGWLAPLSLPLGVTPGDIIDRRARLASGLRRPLGAVWPEPAHKEHGGALDLWVGYRAMNEAMQPPWPLLKAGQHSMFQPVPFGTDQRSRNVALPLMYSNLLTGGLPGSGKTMATRVTLLAGALDPACEIHAWDLSGKGDLSALGKVAHRYGCGLDDGTMAACMDDLRAAYAELERRAAVLDGLPRDLVRENKVTPQVAAKKSLRMHPYMFAIAECQELFTHPRFGKEAAEIAPPFIKRGRGLGMMLLLDTQRPDATSLPPGVSANAGSRFCLRVMDDRANNMILGAGMYAAGYRATQFTPEDLGIGFLVGAGPVPLVVRSYYIDALAADKVTERARKVREGLGLLTGHAAGEETEAGDQVSLLADVAAVMRGEERQHSKVICVRLGELRPELYGRWDATTLANALARYDVDTSQLWVDGANSRGVLLNDVQTALGALARAGR